MGRNRGLVKRIAKQRRNKENFLKLFHNKGSNIAATCEAIGVHRNSYYYWMDTDPEFKEAVSQVEESLIDWVESKLVKKIEDGDVHAITFFLKTKGKSRGYAEKAEYDHPITRFTGIKIITETGEIPEAEVVEEEQKKLTNGKK